MPDKDSQLMPLPQSLVVNAVQGAQEVTGVVAGAALDNVRGGLKGAALVGEDLGVMTKEAARGLIRGASEVGADLGVAAKQAAIGWIHGSAEVGAELGKVLKQSALSAIQGGAEITAELGSVARSNTLGAIQGGGEAALTLESVFMRTARAFLQSYAELKAEQTPGHPPMVTPNVPTAAYSEMPPVVGEKASKGPNGR